MENNYKLKAHKYKIKYLNLKNRMLDLQVGQGKDKKADAVKADAAKSRCSQSRCS
jgi:hypothetical protein